MNWTDERKQQVKEESQKYIDIARDEMESSTTLMEHDKYQHSSTFLKSSLNNLMDCYFVIHETPLTKDEGDRLKLFEKLNSTLVGCLVGHAGSTGIRHHLLVESLATERLSAKAGSSAKRAGCWATAPWKRRVAVSVPRGNRP